MSSFVRCMLVRKSVKFRTLTQSDCNPSIHPRIHPGSLAFYGSKSPLNSVLFLTEDSNTHEVAVHCYSHKLVLPINEYQKVRRISEEMIGKQLGIHWEIMRVDQGVYLVPEMTVNVREGMERLWKICNDIDQALKSCGKLFASKRPLDMNGFAIKVRAALVNSGLQNIRETEVFNGLGYSAALILEEKQGNLPWKQLNVCIDFGECFVIRTQFDMNMIQIADFRTETDAFELLILDINAKLSLGLCHFQKSTNCVEFIVQKCGIINGFEDIYEILLLWKRYFLNDSLPLMQEIAQKQRFCEGFPIIDQRFPENFGISHIEIGVISAESDSDFHPNPDSFVISIDVLATSQNSPIYLDSIEATLSKHPFRIGCVSPLSQSVVFERELRLLYISEVVSTPENQIIVAQTMCGKLNFMTFSAKLILPISELFRLNSNAIKLNSAESPFIWKIVINAEIAFPILEYHEPGNAINPAFACVIASNITDHFNRFSYKFASVRCVSLGHITSPCLALCLEVIDLVERYEHVNVTIARATTWIAPPRKCDYVLRKRFSHRSDANRHQRYSSENASLYREKIVYDSNQSGNDSELKAEIQRFVDCCPEDVEFNMCQMGEICVKAVVKKRYGSAVVEFETDDQTIAWQITGRARHLGLKFHISNSGFSTNISIRCIENDWEKHRTSMLKCIENVLSSHFTERFLQDQATSGGRMNVEESNIDVAMGVDS